MNPTTIGSVKNPDGTQGFTCSPKTGCLYHTEGMCKGGDFPCWAYKLAQGRLKKSYLANLHLAPVADPNSFCQSNDALNDPFYPRFWPERIDQIRTRKKPAGIFMDDMSDWMADYWLREWTEAELQVMRDCPQHWFYTLTKQPQNLAKWAPFPNNCFVGLTITKRLDGIGYMASVNAKVKYICFEPLLYYNVDVLTASELFRVNGIKGVIIGGQTKPTRLPKIVEVRLIVDAADKAGAKVFLKDNLGWPRMSYAGSRPFYTKEKSGTWILRQELPE